jgi:hypothetical protein
MTHPSKLPAPLVLLAPLWLGAAAEDKPVVGLIPKASKSVKLDGKLKEWDGAFVTPVHVGHPDFANRLRQGREADHGTEGETAARRSSRPKGAMT